MLYYRKGATAHKVVSLHKIKHKPTCIRQDYKVGLFIFACCSYYLCRQAMQRETFRKELTMLKLRMYSFTSPPPFVFPMMGSVPGGTTTNAVSERRETVHLVTRLSLYYIIIPSFFWQSLFFIRKLPSLSN